VLGLSKKLLKLPGDFNWDQQLGLLASRFLLHSVHHMRVGVRYQADVSMFQALLDDLRVNCLPQQHGGLRLNSPM
jgi:hypothetical protein